MNLDELIKKLNTEGLRYLVCKCAYGEGNYCTRKRRFVSIDDCLECGVFEEFLTDDDLREVTKLEYLNEDALIERLQEDGVI